ncbi:MAG: hypothetical protein J5698_04635 [Bacteroidaceae bacterium]|nr:hypothetical protein [Bacteroidaceae bacterium]
MKATLLLAATLLASSAALAGTDVTSEALMNDTTEISERNIGKWTIRKTTVTTVDDEDEDGTTTSESVTTTESVSYDIDYRNGIHPHFPAFYIGLSDFNTLPLERQASDIPLSASKSWEWGIYMFQDGISFDRGGHVGLTFALGFGRAMYKFATPSYFFTDTNQTTYFGAPETYDVTWFRYWTLKLPIALTFEKEALGEELFFNIGPELEYRFSSASKGKFNAADKKKEIICKDLNMAPLGVNLMAQVGYNCLSLYAKQSLTGLFRNPSLATPYSTELYPFTLGIAFTF